MARSPSPLPGIHVTAPGGGQREGTAPPRGPYRGVSACACAVMVQPYALSNSVSWRLKLRLEGLAGREVRLRVLGSPRRLHVQRKRQRTPHGATGTYMTQPRVGEPPRLAGPPGASLLRRLLTPGSTPTVAGVGCAFALMAPSPSPLPGIARYDSGRSPADVNCAASRATSTR